MPTCPQVSRPPEPWRLSDEDAPGAAGMLGQLCPSVATLHLPAQLSAAAHSLCTWQAMESLNLDGVQQAHVAALAKLTQLQTLHMFGGGRPSPWDAFKR